ncbi:hypothetical protein COW95_03575 [Candidatus Peregrinibacteria bacterium CG22_combo_CG10-13_8_21_14_all_49_11]|nr:MAG: hypothetical protein COW95_03575 [Candidatus Peregrinibacteria bacterium CG22_combo_CG10-13_8_21_14_all_49_11]
MIYKQFIQERDFSPHTKLAVDLAYALDHPVASDEKSYGIAEKRAEIFNIFCALCVQSGIEVPRLDDMVRRDGLVKHKDLSKEAAAFLAAAEAQLAHVPAEQRERLRELIIAYRVITQIESYSGASTKNITALINDVLVDHPIRPDYSAVAIPSHPESVAPSASTRILIVDDSPPEILNSHLASSGIANTEFRWLLQNCAGYGDFKEGEERAEIENLSAAILAEEPNVVLMDQGLRRLNGSDVVRFMLQELSSKIRFVANTGGDSTELLSATGGYYNFDKGRKKQALYEALRGR